MSPAYREHAAGFADMDWADRTKVIRFMLQEMRIIGSSAHPFDQGRATRLLERDYDRARNFSSATNHFKLKGGEAWKGRLGEIRAPLLVIHGTADPIFPIEHGRALAKAVAGATMVNLDGGGHELHAADWPSRSTKRPPSVRLKNTEVSIEQRPDRLGSGAGITGIGD